LFTLSDYQGDKILNLDANSVLSVNKAKLDTLFDRYYEDFLSEVSKFVDKFYKENKDNVSSLD
jgi:hypothetical protein